jgi:hypothetical protein
VGFPELVAKLTGRDFNFPTSLPSRALYALTCSHPELTVYFRLGGQGDLGTNEEVSQRVDHYCQENEGNLLDKEENWKANQGALS